MRIEFLYWRECPSHETALARLYDVLRDEGVTPSVELVHVGTEQEAARWQFPGSPTIRIDGNDIAEPPEGPGQFGLTCRAYRTDDGRISPLPSTEALRRAVRAARERAHT